MPRSTGTPSSEVVTAEGAEETSWTILDPLPGAGGLGGTSKSGKSMDICLQGDTGLIICTDSVSVVQNSDVVGTTGGQFGTGIRLVATPETVPLTVICLGLIIGTDSESEDSGG